MFWKSTKVIDSEDPNGGGVVDLDPQAVPPITKSPEEKRFLIKLDIFLLTFGCISQVIKYIDQVGRMDLQEQNERGAKCAQTNINFAYVSGMQDALKLTGNELNYFTTYFNVGYCLMLIVSRTFTAHGFNDRFGLHVALANHHHTFPTVHLAVFSRILLGSHDRRHRCLQERSANLRPPSVHWYRREFRLSGHRHPSE